jgi:hypothetical protein
VFVAVDKAVSKDVKQRMSEIKAHIKTRILY